MFFTKRKIRMSEIDVTGAIYFTNLLKFATEALEEFMETRHTNLFKTFQNSDYAFPIVSAKSSYLAPLCLSDEIVITLFLAKKGKSSLEFHTEITKGGRIVGRTEIVHVVISKTTGKKVMIPYLFEELFDQVFYNEGELKRDSLESLAQKELKRQEQ